MFITIHQPIHNVHTMINKQLNRTKEIIVDFCVIVLGFGLALWLYRYELHLVGFSGLSLALPLDLYLRSIQQTGLSYQNLYWGLIDLLHLNLPSSLVVPPIFLITISFYSFFYFMKKILKDLWSATELSSVYIAAGLGSLIYVLGPESFANWGGMAQAHFAIPVFGALTAASLSTGKNKAFVLSVTAFAVYVITFIDYPVFFVLALIPLFVEFVVWGLLKGMLKRVAIYLSVLVISIFLYSTWFLTTQSVANPQIWLTPSLGNKLFLNSGQQIIYLFTGIVNPEIVAHLAKTSFFPLLFIIPLLAYSSLLSQKKLKLPLVLALFSLLIIGLYSIDIIPLGGSTPILLIFETVPLPIIKTMLIGGLGEYRIPQFVLSFMYSLMIGLAIFSALTHLSRHLPQRRSIEAIFIAAIVVGSSAVYEAELGYSNLPYNATSAIPTSFGAFSAALYVCEKQFGSVMWLPSFPSTEFLGFPWKSITTYPWGSDGPSSTWYLSFVVGQSDRVGLLSQGNYMQVATFLADVGIQYLGLYGAYTIYAEPLEQSGYFSVVYNKSGVYVLENMLYRKGWVSNSVLYVDGGLQAYSSLFPYFEMLGYNYTSPVPFYLDRLPVPSLQEYPGTFLIDQLWTPYDLAFQFLNGTPIAPSEYATTTQPPWIAWDTGAVTQVDFPWSFWTNYYGYLNQFTYELRYGLAYTVGLGSPMQKSMEIPVRVPVNGSYVLLIRLYVSPNNNIPLYLKVNGRQSYLLNQNSNSYIGGFVWEAVNITLTTGINKLDLTSDGGVSAVNLMELVTPGQLTLALAKSEELINSSSYMYLVYLTNGTQRLNLPSGGEYKVYAYSPFGGGSLSMATYTSNKFKFNLSKNTSFLGQFYLPSALNITSVSLSYGTTLLLVKVQNIRLNDNYTVIVRNTIYDYSWHNVIHIGGLSYYAYPAYGEGTAYLIGGQ